MLTVILVNYKGEMKTITYIKEELSKIQIPHLIVIVNNAATQESNDTLLHNLNATLVTDINIKPIDSGCYVISCEDNLGFAKGNNLGADFSMKHFDISHIIFSNNDIRFIENDVVEALIKKIDSLPNIGVIGPNVIGTDGRKQSPDPYYPFWNRYIWMYWLTPFLSKKAKNKLFKLNYNQEALEGIHYRVMGSFFLVKSIDFVHCGMMDPNTFLFSEEMILSERMNSIKRYVYFYPKVTVLHEHNQTISKHIIQKKQYLIRFKSESYFYRKYKNVSLISIFLGKVTYLLYLQLMEFKEK